MPAYTCAICKQAVDYEPPTPPVYPFCSERCKLVDLGRWFNEEYSAEGPVTPDLDEIPEDLLP